MCFRKNRLIFAFSILTVPFVNAESIYSQLDNFGLSVNKSIKPIQVKGDFELVELTDGTNAILSKSGQYLILGEVFTKSDSGYSLVGRNVYSRLSDLSHLFYTIKAPLEKRQMIILVDNTCPFCKQLISKIPQLVAAGITVHLLPYSRNGLASPEAHSLIESWRKPNPIKAMYSLEQQDSTKSFSKNDLYLITKFVDDNLDLKGTPFSIIDNGEVIEGAFNVTEFIAYLDL